MLENLKIKHLACMRRVEKIDNFCLSLRQMNKPSGGSAGYWALSILSNEVDNVMVKVLSPCFCQIFKIGCLACLHVKYACCALWGGCFKSCFFHLILTPIPNDSIHFAIEVVLFLIAARKITHCSVCREFNVRVVDIIHTRSSVCIRSTPKGLVRTSN